MGRSSYEHLIPKVGEGEVEGQGQGEIMEGQEWELDPMPMWRKYVLC